MAVPRTVQPLQQQKVMFVMLCQLQTNLVPEDYYVHRGCKAFTVLPILAIMGLKP